MVLSMEEMDELVNERTKKADDENYSEGELVLRMPAHLSDRFHDILNGEKYKFALQDLDNHLRGIYKHSDDEKAQEEAGRFRELIREYLEHWSLALWD